MEKTNKELAKSQSDLKAAQNEILKKDQQMKELGEKHEEVKCCRVTLETKVNGYEAEIKKFKSTHQDDVKRLDQLQSQLTDKTSTIHQLEARVAELEPLAEAIEQEKLRRIKVIRLAIFPAISI